jgi:hypothetical protein
LINAILPGAAAQYGTGLPNNVFTGMRDNLGKLDKWGAGIGGVLGGLMFIWVMKEMLDCEDRYMDAIVAAMVVCGALLGFGKTGALNSIARICNLLNTALQFLMLMTNLQSLSLQYQGCMMAAESQLSTRARQGETGYDRARRIADYYNQLAACHQGLDSNLARFMQRWADFSYNMGSSVSGMSTYVTPTPLPPSVLGPGNKKLSIGYNFPGYGAQREYGQITVTFEYNWYGSSGRLGGERLSSTFSLVERTGTINCDVRPNNDGLDCKETTGGYRRGSGDLTAKQCTQIVTGRDRTGECGTNPWIEGTVTASWSPCDTRSICYYQYGFESIAGKVSSALQTTPNPPAAT